MDSGPEFRWRIDAYTPETMPSTRLAEYLGELTKILEEDYRSPRAANGAKLLKRPGTKSGLTAR